MTEPFLPIAAARVTVRQMRPSDIAPLHAYRNGPHVQYQDWPLPYPLEAATALVESSGAHDGPVEGDWVQMAIELDGELAGDVAVGLEDAGEVATIGVTLRDELQGRGLAREALGAVVERLFAHAGVHRVQATADSRNERSIRLLLALGFRQEGLAREAFRARDGDWHDEAYFGLIVTDPRH